MAATTGTRLLVLLACVIGGALAGAGVGFIMLSGERCAGPVCAGMIIVPIFTAGAGAVVGLIGGAILWVRSRLRAPLRT